MTEQELARIRLRHGRAFSKRQHALLRRCADGGDLSSWNEWRTHHLRMPVLLDRADLSGANLRGAYLFDAHLEGARLGNAKLDGAYLLDAHLQNADLYAARLDKAVLENARLTGAHLKDTRLRGANLVNAHLEGACFQGARLEGARFDRAVVDGHTQFSDCAVDTDTSFVGVGLRSARVDPGLAQTLESNIRRIEWRGWYKKHPALKWPVRLFFGLSDYGDSATRILIVFFVCSFLFAAAYYLAGVIHPPGLVHDLFVHDGIAVPAHVAPARAVYFSIVVMTTLGFGDIHADPTSLAGHLVLSAEVLLGYVLLGALVTRFAVLFTGLGPSADVKPRRRRSASARAVSPPTASAGGRQGPPTPTPTPQHRTPPDRTPAAPPTPGSGPSVGP
jgi:uncharacterized protein YjbI with pentapeptide repeats